MEKEIENHLRSLGCEDSVKISHSIQVYRELCEVRSLYDVEVRYHKEMDVIYLTGRPPSTSQTHLYVAHPTCNPLTLKYVHELQETLCLKEGLSKRLTLVCLEDDSTVALYSFTRGLINVQSPDCLVRQKSRQERRDFLEGEIRKSKISLLARAHANGIVEFPTEMDS